MLRVAIVCCLLDICVLFAGAIPIDMFYPFGLRNGDEALPKGFMERSKRIKVEGGLNFLGSRFYNAWVSNKSEHWHLAAGYIAMLYTKAINVYVAKL